MSTPRPDTAGLKRGLRRELRLVNGSLHAIFLLHRDYGGPEPTWRRAVGHGLLSRQRRLRCVVRGEGVVVKRDFQLSRLRLEGGRLYNLSRVETFYQHRKDEVALVPVFVAFVAPETPVRLGVEHDAHEWLAPPEAGVRFAWPRERRALEDAVQLLGSGDGGAVEDVLRIC